MDVFEFAESGGVADAEDDEGVGAVVLGFGE